MGQRGKRNGERFFNNKSFGDFSVVRYYVRDAIPIRDPMMMIAPNSRALKREGVVWRNLWRGIHIASCVKVVEWRLGTRGLGMLAAFWAGIPVELK